MMNKKINNTAIPRLYERSTQTFLLQKGQYFIELGVAIITAGGGGFILF